MNLTGTSKATATRDLGEMVGGGQLWTKGAGKALPYYVNVPWWSHGLAEVQAAAATPPSLGGGLLSQASRASEQVESPAAAPGRRPKTR